MAAKEGEDKPPAIGSATVGLNEVNTIEPQCDKRDPNFARWYDTGSDKQGVKMPPVRTGNDVEMLIDGTAAFAAMVTAIQAAKQKGHFIYLLGWIMQIDFSLTRGNTMRSLLTAASQAGVEIRVMLWDQPKTTNTAEVAFVNSLTNGSAILDNRTLNLGAHHQKVLITSGENGLVCFCGGIDVNEDRIHHVKAQPGSPMHDVHCRIKGPAAWDLLHLFQQRWSDHPDVKSLPTAKQGLTGASIADPGNSGSDGTQYVQISRTFGNGAKNGGIDSQGFSSKGYSFAPKGEQTIWQMVRHGIQAAQEFIYLEDQYLISMDASTALRDQLPKIKKLIILMPHSSISDLPGVWKRRNSFITNLLSKGNADKVIICVRFPEQTPRPKPFKTVDPDTWETYVHAKMWVMDDKFAIIGSANCNNRGYTHDSEVAAGIYDESLDSPCTLHFAHRLRMKLWAEHLKLPESAMFDPIAASVVWSAPGTSTCIALYDPNADTDHSPLPNVAVDPDGS